jgi:hypothetical protein
VDKYNVGLCKPEKFQEFYVRLFVRDSNKYDAAHYAFEKFTKKFIERMDDNH